MTSLVEREADLNLVLKVLQSGMTEDNPEKPSVKITNHWARTQDLRNAKPTLYELSSATQF